MSVRKVIGFALAGALAFGLAIGGAHAADQTDGLFQRIRVVYNVVQRYHKDGADVDKFVHGAIKGGLDALGDPYTQYFTPTDFENFMNSLNGSFIGIGAYLEQQDNYVVITAPIKGSPAEKAGLQTGDRILEVNGLSVVGAPTDKAVSLIRGVAGTVVTLKIERPAENRTFTLNITRALVTIPEVESKMMQSNIGYIQLSSFGERAAGGFFKAVTDLKAQGAKGIVLDLRQNGGGYVDAAVDIAGAFVPKDEPILWEVGKAGKEVRRSAGRLINLPTAVLVDNGTASASEILAGAIQDYQAGPLVGIKTFGKGTVQQILTLTGEAGGIKVTVAEYLTPKERHVHHIGLTPDFVVENPPPAAERVKPMELTRLLATGTVGLDVLYVQYRLEDLGYAPDGEGFFGNKTAQAVQIFARDNGLTSGVGVDPGFIAVLNRKVAEHAQAAKQADRQLLKATQLVIDKLGHQ